jgi:GNAT superfamily N-acetyltransferase
MTDYSIRSLQLPELNNIYKKIKNDFVQGEYAPYDILYHQLQDGNLKGYLLLAGDREVAYSICAEEHKNNYVLISLLAVYEKLRGSGYGTAFLKEIAEMYSDKNGLIVEVEKPDNANTKEEKKIREKRIEFYKKAGFSLLPNIEYTIWGMPMHLMALPLKASIENINENIEEIIYEIYLTLMGKTHIDKMKIFKL